MFNKVKVNHLRIVFGVLFVIFIISLFGGNTRKNRSFISELTRIDTAAVKSLVIYPMAGKDPVYIEKEGNNWIVSDGKNTWNADNGRAEQMLTTLDELASTRLAATEKDRWESFEVTDSLATRVQVKTGKKTVADIYIGKFSYAPPPQAANPYMQRQQGTMTSYVRLEGKKEVYAVEGFLRMMFNQSASDFRDRNILKLDKKNIERIAFQLPGDQFSLIKNENRWMIDGLASDSAATAGYLSAISSLRGSNFLPDEAAGTGTPTHSVLFEGANGVKLGQVNVYFSDSTNIALTSSQNPGTVFDGTSNELFEKVVKGRGEFGGE